MVKAGCIEDDHCIFKWLQLCVLQYFHLIAVGCDQGISHHYLWYSLHNHFLLLNVISGIGGIEDQRIHALVGSIEKRLLNRHRIGLGHGDHLVADVPLCLGYRGFILRKRKLDGSHTLYLRWNSRILSSHIIAQTHIVWSQNRLARVIWFYYEKRVPGFKFFFFQSIGLWVGGRALYVHFSLTQKPGGRQSERAVKLPQTVVYAEGVFQVSEVHTVLFGQPVYFIAL